MANGRLITLPGCPMNVENLVATWVHYITFHELPPSDGMGRPLFAYGDLIHNKCERRPHFEFGEFALAWGDEGAQKGWCLYKLGCKGPETMANCPTARYGAGISWNVRAGAGCIGCTMPHFWDAMGAAYRRLPPVVPFLPNVTVDQVGVAMVAGITAVAGVHAVGMGVRFKRRAIIEDREAATATAEAGTAPTVDDDTAVGAARRRRGGRDRDGAAQPPDGAAPRLDAPDRRATAADATPAVDPGAAGDGMEAR